MPPRWYDSMSLLILNLLMIMAAGGGMESHLESLLS